jgi:hypothetical protein
VTILVERSGTSSPALSFDSVRTDLSEPVLDDEPEDPEVPTALDVSDDELIRAAEAELEAEPGPTLEPEPEPEPEPESEPADAIDIHESMEAPENPREVSITSTKSKKKGKKMKIAKKSFLSDATDF